MSIFLDKKAADLRVKKSPHIVSRILGAADFSYCDDKVT